MPVPAIDPQKRSDAYKKVSPVAGIAEQGLVPDPDVMHTLFSRLFAILGPVGILPVIFAVNSVSTACNFAAAFACGAPPVGMVPPEEAIELMVLHLLLNPSCFIGRLSPYPEMIGR